MTNGISGSICTNPIKTTSLSPVKTADSNVTSVKNNTNAPTSNNVKSNNEKLSLLGGVKGFLRKSAINIFQCGPQFHCCGVDVKLTPTFVCASENMSCFWLHPEVGSALPIPDSAFKGYVLGIHNQTGVRIKYNDSWNPKNWSYVAVTEKLEHIEITFPYASINIPPFSGSVQGLIAVECGKTTEIKGGGAKAILNNTHCSIPTAVTELAFRTIKEKMNFCSNQPEEVISNQPVASDDSITQVSTDLNSIDMNKISEKTSDNIVRMLDAAFKSKNPDETFWFGLTIGPCDINTAKKFGINDSASFSLQLNNYFRLNFMFTYKDGKFSMPENIGELKKHLKSILGSNGAVKSFIDNIISKIKAKSDDNKAIEMVAVDLKYLSETSGENERIVTHL